MKMLKATGRMLSDIQTKKPVLSSSWREDKQSSTQRGYGYKWQQKRKAFLSRPENVLCLFCRAKGLVTQATVVDHIKPHRGNEVLFWDETNWQPLCSSCHSSDKQRIEVKQV